MLSWRKTWPKNIKRSNNYVRPKVGN